MNTRPRWRVAYGRSGRRRGVFARHRDVDDITVERALHGEPVPAAGTTEREKIVALLTERQQSNAEIARVLAVAPRSVGRIRARIREREGERR